MRAITLRQPWATLVALGAKRIETRRWRTSHRGPLAVHAAAAFPPEARALCGSPPFVAALAGGGFSSPELLPLGAVVAVATLIDVREITPENGPAGEPERAFGDYSPGRFMWLLEGVTPLARPIPARGTLGLWEWDGSGLEDALKRGGIAVNRRVLRPTILRPERERFPDSPLRRDDGAE
jgi:hypothetical protein